VTIINQCALKALRPFEKKEFKDSYPLLCPLPFFSPLISSHPSPGSNPNHSVTLEKEFLFCFLAYASVAASSSASFVSKDSVSALAG